MTLELLFASIYFRAIEEDFDLFNRTRTPLILLVLFVVSSLGGLGLGYRYFYLTNINIEVMIEESVTNESGTGTHVELVPLEKIMQIYLDRKGKSGEDENVHFTTSTFDSGEALFTDMLPGEYTIHISDETTGCVGGLGPLHVHSFMPRNITVEVNLTRCELKLFTYSRK